MKWGFLFRWGYKGIPYYSRIYEEGNNYIAMDYIERNTLFQCLEKGIIVTKNKIQEVDEALEQARQRGLNPSDIHLKNIILTPKNEIKIIDVARFRQKKKDRQWDDLRKAYDCLYTKRYFPKKIPAKVLNTISFFYKKRFLPKNGEKENRLPVRKPISHVI